MSNVLITGATHALAQKIARNLEARYQIFFADALPIPEIMLKSGKYMQIPYATQPTFAHEILNLLLDKDITLLVPLRDKEINVLSTCKTLFEEYGIQVAAPDREELEVASFVANPPVNMIPLVWLNGECLSQTDGFTEPLPIGLNGVCVMADSGEEYFYCCLT